MAQAPGNRIAAPSMPSPEINIMLRRSIYNPPIVKAVFRPKPATPEQLLQTVL
ncbi:hypothetical protein MSEO_44150 [Mycobacterium seoulense]|uniref:Uncharacterized protein n=1 Tax=Mycobacterium seoulense TaxID=386911 RepID=A0A7I7P4X6_9MYCO|nr:hypothetical protein MSEO_44150 [Mycobacterium seoulense]